MYGTAIVGKCFVFKHTIIFLLVLFIIRCTSCSCRCNSLPDRVCSLCSLAIVPRCKFVPKTMSAHIVIGAYREDPVHAGTCILPNTPFHLFDNKVHPPFIICIIKKPKSGRPRQTFLILMKSVLIQAVCCSLWLYTTLRMGSHQHLPHRSQLCGVR